MPKESTRSGALAVAVYSSNPKFGDPYEFVFYLEPPYRPEMLDRKRKAMVKLWVETKGKQGLDLRTVIKFTGPYNFFQDDRVDLDEKHRGDHEFQLKAWFRRRHPLILDADVIDKWMQDRAEFGYPVNEPRRIAEGPLQSKGFSTDSGLFRSTQHTAQGA